MTVRTFSSESHKKLFLKALIRWSESLQGTVSHQLKLFTCLKTFSGCKSFTHLNLSDAHVLLY